MNIALLVGLGVIFFFSGISCLIYQVTWQRLLTVYYGVGMVSVTLIVSIYMFGLGLGALLGGYCTERIKNRIVLYCLVELAIGILGIISFPMLQFLGQHTAGSPYWIAGCYQFLFLSLPTILMGMTLPILTKIFNHILSNFVKTVSTLYFINTLGAAFGAIAGSYILISFLGIDTAIYAAAGINLLLALFIFSLRNAAWDKERPQKNYTDSFLDKTKESKNKFYWFVFITGFLAIGYEIVWFRIITVLVKPSAYTFSSVLAVYLFGIALGSLFMGRMMERFPSMNKKKLFFGLQVMIAASVAGLLLFYYYVTLHTSFSFLTKFSFEIPVHPPPGIFFENIRVSSLKGFLNLLFWAGDIFLWSAFFMLIPTFFMGASFPLISALALEEANQEARTIGRIYFFNILGNVMGGLITGFMLLPVLGTEPTLVVFILIGGGFAIGLTTQQQKLTSLKKAGFILGIVMILIFFPKKGQLYPLMHTPPGPDYQTYFEEGKEGVVMTYQKDATVINYINGHSHGGRPGYTFYAHVIQAAAVAPSVENVLVIGYGTGSITEAVLKIPGVQKVTVVEINQTLTRNFKKMPLFQNLLSDSRLEMVFDDGRRFLLRQSKKFDLIFMSPLRTTTAYANNLYSQQFFELARNHLKPEGILMAWTDELEVMSHTLASVFPNIRLYIFGPEGFFLASSRPMTHKNPMLVGAAMSLFSTNEQLGIAATTSRLQLLEGPRFLNYVKNFPVNQDWKPIGEYYIGLQRIKQK